MKLFTVRYGKSKSSIRQKLMTGSQKQCENYVFAREQSIPGFHSILPATGDESAFKKNKWKTGYVQNGMFNNHT